MDKKKLSLMITNTVRTLALRFSITALHGGAHTFSKPTTIVNLIASVLTGTSSRRLALAVTIIFLGSTSASLAATYKFLTVTGNGIAGNAATSKFSSSINGYIDVTHSFPGGVWGLSDNNNALITPSEFTTLFPGTGNVDGHLVQSMYNSTSLVTFDLTNYQLSKSTVFGMWNTTDEVSAPPPPGGSPVYRIELLVNNVAGPPTTFNANTVGTQDNTGSAGVLGRSQMVLDASTGAISAGAFIHGGAGTHTNALFWDNLPIGTTEIRVYGDLPPLNNVGDGVGYYFAEIVPEPSSIALLLCGGGALLFARWRQSR